jgi:hypothetical protein
MSDGRRLKRVLAFAIVGAMVLAGCSTGAGGAGERTTTATGSDMLACASVNNVFLRPDMTPLRGRSLLSYGLAADDPSLKYAALRLRGSGTQSEVNAAVEAMAQACTRMGIGPGH